MQFTSSQRFHSYLGSLDSFLIAFLFDLPFIASNAASKSKSKFSSASLSVNFPDIEGSLLSLKVFIAPAHVRENIYFEILKLVRG